MKIIVLNREYCPRRIIRDNILRKITWIKKDYVINKVKIFLDVPKDGNYLFDSKLVKVIINKRHPNSNPKNGEFCLPDKYKQSSNLNFSEFLEDLERMLVTFNVDSCYWSPTLTIDYGDKIPSEEEKNELIRPKQFKSNVIIK